MSRSILIQPWLNRSLTYLENNVVSGVNNTLESPYELKNENPYEVMRIMNT